MENNKIELNNKLEKNNLIEKSNIEEQKSFLETNLGKTINGAVDWGIKSLLPDFIEDDIIEIKDSIITDGFKEGIKTAIDNSIELGKSVLGIFTGKFENISQIKEVIKKGGLIDGISDVIDWGINKAKSSNLITKDTANLIKKGKNAILNNVENGVENNLESQVESIEKIDGYVNKWYEYYEKQDFTNMQKNFTKMQKELEKVVPLENVIKKAKIIENLHTLIKNNGKDFNLSEYEKELANKLI